MRKDASQTTRLFAAMDHMRRVWQNLRPSHDLTKAQFGTLMVLANSGKMPTPADPHTCTPGRAVMTLSALAAAMGQTLPSISQRIRPLDSMGYVERVPDPSDRRVSGIRISDSGISLLNQAKKEMGARVEAAIDVLGSENLELLLNLLEQFAAALETAAANENGGVNQTC